MKKRNGVELSAAALSETGASNAMRKFGVEDSCVHILDCSNTVEGKRAVIVSKFSAGSDPVIASEAKQSSVKAVSDKKINKPVTLNFSKNPLKRSRSVIFVILRMFQGLTSRKLAKAFSLIELMISLIVVSCITAAFTPVITKKLKSGSLVAGAVSGGLKNLQISPEECKKAIGVDNCTICDVKKGECISCSSDTCDKTHQYTITKNCSCAECSSKFSKCMTCSETACTKCNNGSLLNGDMCEDCPVGKVCDGTNKTPQNPPSGYYSKDGISYECSKAISNCKVCSATKSGTTTVVTCSKCAKNTYLKSDNKSCVSCSASQYCPEGTAQSGIKTCSQLTTNCTTCSADGCSKCSGTLKLSGGKCVTCDNGYTCDGTGTQTQCTTAGYYCTGGQSYGCSSKTANCIECSRSTGVCTQCTVGTHKLTSSNTCTTCAAGYWCDGKTQNNNTCTTGCASCAGASSCTTCSNGYYKNGTTCASCPAGYWCSGGSKAACDAGTWSNGGTGCTVKSTCCTATVTEGNWCANGSCASCTTGCSKCASASTCTTCSNGYSKNSSNTCDTCPAGYWCSGGTKTACTGGKWSTSSVNNTSSSACSSCPAGYWCSGGNKYTCTAGTWTSAGASAASSCTSANCGPGYWCANGSKSSGVCTANCNTCSSSTKCASNGCKSGYTWSAGSCTANCPWSWTTTYGGVTYCCNHWVWCCIAGGGCGGNVTSCTTNSSPKCDSGSQPSGYSACSYWANAWLDYGAYWWYLNYPTNSAHCYPI